MEHRIIISGFGGQGVLFTGKIIAQAAVIEGKEATWLPSYGPEMRGGTANCKVVISDEEIGSPAVKNADIVIAMNVPSVTKFAKYADGILITDTKYIKYCPEQLNIAEVETSLCNGGGRFEGLTNMLMLGAVIKRTGIVGLDAVKESIKKMAKPAIAALDIEALEFGMSNA